MSFPFYLLWMIDHPGSLKKGWPDWVSMFLKLAKIEASSRPALKKQLHILARAEGVQRVDGK